MFLCCDLSVCTFGCLLCLSALVWVGAGESLLLNVLLLKVQFSVFLEIDSASCLLAREVS